MQISQKKIFIVDDEPDILAFLQELLKQEGYTVEVAEKSGPLEKLSKKDALPDLILLDVFLSGSDGREVVRHLKDQEKTRRIPVIMFSAYPGIEKTARQAGADDFVAKPFDIDEVLAKIAQCLS